MPPNFSETRSRDAAIKALETLWVQAPEDIELDLLASQCGLSILDGGLKTSDGRIVANQSKSGFIRVRAGVQSPGRRRFIVAHELGHFHLHKRQSYTDTLQELSTYRSGSIETEANIFAAELLMPDFLFKVRIHDNKPSHFLLRTLAGDFSTSHLATIVQYITYTDEPCALVYSLNGLIQWTRKSANWEWWIRDSKVHPDSGAGEFFSSGQIPSAGMVKTPAGAWLPQFSEHGAETIQEDVHVWPQQRVALSLLWVDDVL